MVGGFGMFGGRRRAAAAMADCNDKSQSAISNQSCRVMVGSGRSARGVLLLLLRGVFLRLHDGRTTQEQEQERHGCPGDGYAEGA